MKVIAKDQERSVNSTTPAEGDELFTSLLEQASTPAAVTSGPVVGELIALTDRGQTPLVTYPTQSRAVAARSTIDLLRIHIGRSVVLLFEDGDPLQPIVVGVLRSGDESDLLQQRAPVEVQSDGERLTVSARTEIVLRCGQASITLKSDGEISLKGTRVSSHSSGVNRITGGSVQLN